MREKIKLELRRSQRLRGKKLDANLFKESTTVDACFGGGERLRAAMNAEYYHLC